ncbi:hypothetical protein PAEPH01_1770, partial [Pancytospora epiphaga]
MKIFQQFLTVSASAQSSFINADAKNMLREITKNIKSNKSTRKNGDLVFEIKPTPVDIPNAVNAEKEKSRWQL